MSNGLDETSGLSLNLVARARARQKPAIDNGLMQESTPPANITSAASICCEKKSPFRILMMDTVESNKKLHQDWREVCGKVFEILRLNKKIPIYLNQ